MIPTGMLLDRGRVLPVMEHTGAQPTTSILGLGAGEAIADKVK